MSNSGGKFLISDTKPYDLYVNSRDRTDNSASSNEFRVNLNNCAQHIRTVKLLEATMPNVFYTFRDDANVTNNWFDFIDSTGPQSFQITPGSYTTAQLITELLAQFASVSPDTYTITYSQTTLLLNITSNSALFQILGATGPNVDNNALSLLGYNDVDTTAGTVQLAPNAINIAGPKNVFIRCTAFGNPIHSSQNNLAAIFYIPLNAGFGNINFYQTNNQYDSEFFVNLQSLAFLQIAVFGSDGKLLDFHGADWDMLLRFS